MSAIATGATPAAVPDAPQPAAPTARPAAAARPTATAPVAVPGQRPITATPGGSSKPSPAPKAAAAPAAAPALPVNTWAAFFRNWPKMMPTRGVVISRLNESTTFKSFMLQGDLLLLERISPDSVGARFVVLPFDEIATVKYTDQLKQPALESAGFVGNLAK